MGISIDGSNQFPKKNFGQQDDSVKDLKTENKLIFEPKKKADNEQTWKGVSFSNCPTEPPVPEPTGGDETPPTAGDPPVPGDDPVPVPSEDEQTPPLAGDPPVPSDDDPVPVPSSDDTTQPTAGDPPVPDDNEVPPDPDPTIGDFEDPNNEGKTAADVLQVDGKAAAPKKSKGVFKAGDRVPDGYKLFSIKGEPVNGDIVTTTGVYILKEDK